MTPLIPLLASLLGCITGSAWPHHIGGVAGDSGDPTTTFPTTPTLPCNRAPEGTTAQLTVQNPTSDRYQLSQMDDACVEQFLTFVEPSDAFVGNVGNHIFFVIREEDGRYVRFFGLPSGTNVSWVESLP